MRKGLKWGMKGLKLLFFLVMVWLLLEFINTGVLVLDMWPQYTDRYESPREFYLNMWKAKIPGARVKKWRQTVPDSQINWKEILLDESKYNQYIEPYYDKQTLKGVVTKWKESFQFYDWFEYIIVFIIIIIGFKIRKGFRKYRIEEAGAKIFKKMSDEKLLKEIKSGERFIFEKDGKPAAAVVSMEDFKKIKNFRQGVELKKATG